MCGAILMMVIGYDDIDDEFLHFPYHLLGCKLRIKFGREIVRGYDARCYLALNDHA